MHSVLLEQAYTILVRIVKSNPQGEGGIEPEHSHGARSLTVQRTHKISNGTVCYPGKRRQLSTEITPKLYGWSLSVSAKSSVTLPTFRLRIHVVSSRDSFSTISSASFIPSPGLHSPSEFEAGFQPRQVCRA